MITDSLPALQRAVSDRITGCVLSLPTVISSCDPDYVAPHRPLVRDTADPTVQALLVLCSTVHQAYKDGLVLMQQKAIENIKHICRKKEHSPLEARGNPPPPAVREFGLYVCQMMHLFASDFTVHILPTMLNSGSLCGPHRGAGCVLRIISWWRSWLAAEQRKLCLATAAQLRPFLRQTADTLDPKLLQLQGRVERVQSKNRPCSQINVCRREEWPPRMRNNTPTHAQCVCFQGSHSPANSLLLSFHLPFFFFLLPLLLYTVKSSR